MRLENNQKVFIELMRAGLWEKEVQLSQYENIDYKCIYKIAEEQSVVGLVSAGFEHVKDVKAPQEDVLAFVASALQIEQRNTAMNHFVADLIKQFQKQGVHYLLRDRGLRNVMSVLYGECLATLIF